MPFGPGAVSIHKIAIIGGGPAGLAAAVALTLNDPNAHVELFEASSRLGGRTTSFTDPVSGVMLDTCQHVLMGCCTATIDFFKTLDLLDRFDVHDRYHFFDASGRCHHFAATRGLPAPLHLLPAFWRLKYLTRADRLRIMRDLMRLQKMTPEQCTGRTIGDWLAQQGQSRQACNRFWSVVLVSALSETLDRASLAAARKVFVDGFLASRDAYQLWTPRQPIGTIFDEAVGPWLEKRGVVIHRKNSVKRVWFEEKGGQAPFTVEQVGASFLLVAKGASPPFSSFPIETTDGQTHLFDQIIVAAKKEACLPPSFTLHSSLFTLQSSPITAIHLWFDRPVSDLPHAVLIDQGGNWMFRPPYAEPNYAQLVVSASRYFLGLARAAREEKVHRLAAELVQTVSGNKTPTPKLLRHHTITHPRAVFSITPDSDQYRGKKGVRHLLCEAPFGPFRQKVPDTFFPENLFLAGDWTATGWPATIEGAIRSGIAATQAVVGQDLS